MNRLGVDAWRIGVGVQTLALTIYASPIGYGSQVLAACGHAAIAIVTLMMAIQRPAVPRWLRAWGITAAAFCGFAAASSIWSVSPRASLVDAMITGLVFAFLLLTAASRWLQRSTLRADLVFLLIVIVLLQASALIAGMVGVETIFDPDYGRFRGWFSNANYAGMLSAFGLALGLNLLLVRDDREESGEPLESTVSQLSRRAWWLILAACCVLFAVMVLAQSRGALLALALAVMLLVFPRIGWRRSVATLAVAVAVGGSTVLLAGLVNDPIAVDDPSSTTSGGSKKPRSFDPITRDPSTDVTSGRGFIYRELLDTTREHPLGGTGYRTTELNPELHGTAGHNIYLSTFAEVGLIGGLLFLALLAIPVLRALRDYRPTLGAASATGAALVVLSEVFESSILGWGSPTTLMAWLLLLSGACAIDARTPDRSPASRS